MSSLSLRRPLTAIAVTAFSLLALNARPASADVLYLEFLNPANGTQWNYTESEKQTIRDIVAADYAPFGHTVTLTQPGSGSFSKVTINATTAFNGNALQGGIAQGVDFRDLNKNDNARVNTAGLLTGGDNNSANQVNLTAFIAAHESGHLMGLRHGDSLGAIGSGLPLDTLTEGDYFPTFPSGLPNAAIETYTSIMASPASVGQFISEAATPGHFFNERSSVKLAFNNSGTTINEQVAAHGNIASAQALSLASLVVPNLIPEFIPGTSIPTQNFGKEFDVSALNVLGNISAAGQSDFYSFTAEAGDLFNFEAISNAINPGGTPRYANRLDSNISIFNSNGTLAAYYNGTATNDDEFETFDSILIDWLAPTTGTFFINVNATSFDPTDTGNYELFMYRFAANSPVVVPEAGTLALALMALPVGFLVRRRRK